MNWSCLKHFSHPNYQVIVLLTRTISTRAVLYSSSQIFDLINELERCFEITDPFLCVLRYFVTTLTSTPVLRSCLCPLRFRKSDATFFISSSLWSITTLLLVKISYSPFHRCDGYLYKFDLNWRSRILSWWLLQRTAGMLFSFKSSSIKVPSPLIDARKMALSVSDHVRLRFQLII